MLFQNILVPVDLSNQSTRAFKVALDIAKKYNSKVIILTCIEKNSSDHLYYSLVTSPRLLKKRIEVAKKHFEKLESIAKKNNVSVRSKIITSSSPVNTIVTFAKSKKQDLVVIGSHGRTGFDKWLLGSVANGVSQKTKCPILIVK